jgi:hypothetical protein
VFKSRFYFDIGYDIDERLVLEEPPSQQIYYGFPKLSEQNYGIHDYRGFWPNIRAGKNNRIIGLLQANQGYNLLDSKYKVIWSYMNPQRFYFTDMPVIWPRNRMCAIGSDNKREIMYLFALLNSSVTKRILKWQVETEQEKDLLISIASIKEYIRTPNIAENIRIKEQIIQSVEELLSAEDSVLSLFVDFSSILLQEFDRVEVSGKTLVLTKDKAKSILKIEGKTDLIATLIASKCCENGLYTPFKLNELRNLQVIDSQRQELLKRFIDDLVFALYFNVPLSTQNIRNESKTHIACADNKFYKLV